MAPGYRASGRDRNRNRTLPDHDVFEGLPVRNWRRDTVTIAPPPTHEAASKPTDKWDVELPWGMPKDSHLLPQHSQDLLRAARSGRLYVKRAAAEEEEVDAEVILGEKPEKKEDNTKDKGFMVKTWKLVPKHQEGPEIEHLAKRRKGLVGNVTRPAVPAPVMTQTKVKRTDAAGNSYVEELVVAQGQAVEGEVISQTVIPDIASAGAPITPQRRRDRPKPKRKPKGPGRGRKRKAVQAPTSVPGAPGAVKVEGGPQAPGTEASTSGADGTKLETSTPTANDDTEMGDGSLVPSGDEGEDDEDGSSEDEDDPEDKGEGEGGDDHNEEIDHNNSEVPSSDLTPPKSHEQQEQRTPPEQLRPSISHGLSGSPLKKVMTPPTFENPNINPSGYEEAEGDVDDPVDEHLDTGMDDDHDYPIDDELENPYHQMGGQMGSPEAVMMHHPENDLALDLHDHDHHLDLDHGHDNDHNLDHDHDHSHGHDPSGAFGDEMLLDADMDFSAMAAVSGALEDHGEHHGVIPTEPPILESTLAEMEESLEEVEGEEGFEDLLGGLIGHLDAQGPDAPAADATLEALEDVATAADPDAALEEAAAVARSGEIAEAGGAVEEPLAAEPVVEVEMEALTEEAGNGDAAIADVEEEQEQKAAEIAENLEIPVEAVGVEKHEVKEEKEEEKEEEAEEKKEEEVEKEVEKEIEKDAEEEKEAKEETKDDVPAV